MKERKGILRVEVLRQLYFHSALSVGKLSKLTQKSIPLVTSAINSLIIEGYVTDVGQDLSSGGRRAILYRLNPQKNCYIVAVAIDQLITRVIMYDLAKQVIAPELSININSASDPEALIKLINFIQHCISESGVSKSDILGVGIGMPGFINVDQGINYSFFPTGNHLSLADHLKVQFDLPVFIDNDSSLIALAELKFGKAKGRQHAMVINIGWGTGLGMIIHGQIFRGFNGFAGEFSHIPLSNSKNLCSCGKRDCLEVETSLLVMTTKAKTAINSGAKSMLRWLFEDDSKHPGEFFLDAACQGDPLAVSILSESAFYLGKGIATLIHIINPEKIILSGRGAVAGKIFLPSIQQAINEYCIPRLSELTSIEVSDIATHAELLGAANLVVENSEFEEVPTTLEIQTPYN